MAGQATPHGDPSTAPDTATDAEVIATLRACAAERAALDAREARWVAEFDRRGLAEHFGARDTADWLTRHTQAGAGAARAAVARAATLHALPKVAERLAAGAISSDYVTTLGRAIDQVGADRVAAAEDELLRRASGAATPQHFARRVRSWLVGCHLDDGHSVDEACAAQRAGRLWRDRATGALRLFAELYGDDAALVHDTLWDLAEELWRDEHGPDLPMPSRARLTTDQRLADALAEMARRSLGNGSATGGRPRPTVVVHLDHAALLRALERSDLTGLELLDRDGGPVAWLADGTLLTVAAARRLACDADLLPAVLNGAGMPLDLGRSSRLASTAQRHAMRARSTTCEWPGCLVPADRCEAHHLTAWEHGGHTDLDNLAWTCTRHHRLAHDGGWSLTRSETGAMTALPPPSERPPPGDPRRPVRKRYRRRMPPSRGGDGEDDVRG